jgi:uncharacterized SAM-binding protein YcdF (DUF218 family)
MTLFYAHLKFFFPAKHPGKKVYNLYYNNIEMKNKDFYIVLGCRINDDCTISEMLKSRFDVLIKNLKNNDCYIILSGGYTNNLCNKSEAGIMKDYIIKNGINEDIILIEDKSQNTIGNAIYTMKLLDNLKFHPEKLKLITSCFHVKRSYNIFKYLLKDIEIDSSLCSQWNIDHSEIERKKWLMDKKFIDLNINNSIDNIIKNLQNYHNRL